MCRSDRWAGMGGHEAAVGCARVREEGGLGAWGPREDTDLGGGRPFGRHLCRR